jgi:hypothetical protein
VGMVTTLHLNSNGGVDCLGHDLGPQGQLFSFGEGLKPEQIEKLPRLSRTAEFPVWSPCSGGALYRSKALSAVRTLTGCPDLVRPKGFKSYNCDALANILRAAGYRNSYTLDAVCTRDRTGSSSKKASDSRLVDERDQPRCHSLKNFCKLWGVAVDSSCQLSTLQRSRSFTGHTHFITAYHASIRAGLLASASTQNEHPST